MKSNQLQGKLGLVDAIFLGLGAIIGAGVFVVTGLATQVAGPSMLLGFLLAGTVALFNALSVAQLARLYPYSGGTYMYARNLLNPLAGFVAGWMFLASRVAAGSAVALSFAGYFQVLVPAAPEKMVALGLTVLLTLVNLKGVRKASFLNTLIVSFTASALGVFVLFGLPKVSLGNFIPFAPHGLNGVLRGAALLFFAYTGYARIATLGEEVKNPGLVIPRAILTSLIGSTFLYLLVSYTLIGTVPVQILISQMPLENAARYLGMDWLEFLVALAALTSMISVHLGQLLATSRMFFAMASFAILVYYGLTNVAALKLPSEHRIYPRIISWIGLISCFVLAFSLSQITIISGLAVLGVGLVYYTGQSLRKRKED